MAYIRQYEDSNFVLEDALAEILEDDWPEHTDSQDKAETSITSELRQQNEQRREHAVDVGAKVGTCRGCRSKDGNMPWM